MQSYISNNGVPRRPRCDQGDHRAIWVVERIIQTLKRGLGVMRTEQTNNQIDLLQT